MRMLIGLFALVTVAHATIGPPISRDLPRVISVMFKSGDAAVFGLNSNTSLSSDGNSPVETIQLNVAMKFYEVPLIDCRSLKDVHVETATFLDSTPAKRSEGTFVFTFRMGDEGTRKLGELPQIHITYVKGQFQSATITHASVTSPLCFAPL